jgi:sulfate adenylyltransferase
MTVPHLVAPHGGELVDRIVPAADVESWRSRAAVLPTLVLDARELADLELIATGAASPLTGFLGGADYTSVLERLRLADGTVWPLPFTLAVTAQTARTLSPASQAALADGTGRTWGVIDVSEVFERDPVAESAAVYGNNDPAHPGVAYLLRRPHWLVAGAVHVLPLPPDLPLARHRLTPRQLRAVVAARGWRRVAGFHTRNPIHRAHEHLTKVALEVTDGLVLHPIVEETTDGDVPATVRFEAYERLVEAYYPRERTLLAAFPGAMRHAGPREAVFDVIVSKNYGITHLIVGPDHAGVGDCYRPLAAHEIFDTFGPDDLGVAPLRLDLTFYCRACEGPASARSCPHGAEDRLDLSGMRIRQILGSGGRLPREFTRPVIAELLRAHYTAADRGATRQVPPTGGAFASQRGFIVWFTGLSGSGKSTLAEALRRQLSGGRRVEILDGDEIRTNLSKGLGFSKEDRDLNVRRIGFVARLLARNGVPAVTAAISPYAEVRQEVRRLAADDGVPFVEVYVEAPLNVLAERDVKGLYQEAIAGRIEHFTGVSDPYEPPVRPEVVVRSDREHVDGSIARIIQALLDRGLVTAAVAEAVSQ